jgi:hypothetical protein
MSLVEVVIALTILTTVLMSLGALMASVARHARRATAATYVTAAATTASAWAQALPWDSLDGSLPCITDTIGVFTYDRCTTLQDSTTRLTRVIMVIVPTGPVTAPAETVVVDRYRLRDPSPFNAN